MAMTMMMMMMMMMLMTMTRSAGGKPPVPAPSTACGSAPPFASQVRKSTTPSVRRALAWRSSAVLRRQGCVQNLRVDTGLLQPAWHRSAPASWQRSASSPPAPRYPPAFPNPCKVLPLRSSARKPARPLRGVPSSYPVGGTCSRRSSLLAQAFQSQRMLQPPASEPSLVDCTCNGQLWRQPLPT